MRPLAALLPLGLVLTACGPISPERATIRCEDRARESAAGPRTSVGIGINSNGGVSTGLAIGINADSLSGRSPQEVYERCFRDATGGQEPVGEYAWDAL